VTQAVSKAVKKDVMILVSPAKKAKGYLLLPADFPIVVDSHWCSCALVLVSSGLQKALVFAGLFFF